MPSLGAPERDVDAPDGGHDLRPLGAREGWRQAVGSGDAAGAGAREGKEPDTATDGVVAFPNARIDGAESELMIPGSGHSVQGHPLTIEEVRRILLAPAAAVCRASGWPAAVPPVRGAAAVRVGGPAAPATPGRRIDGRGPAEY